MCGIAGVIRFDGRMVSPKSLSEAGRKLAHRGPDDEGFLSWDRRRSVCLASKADELSPGEVGFVHRRLSILDLSEAGHQPMSTPDGRFHVVFNGEIYNYIELRQDLELMGEVFSTGTDTEVLLRAYAVWGEGCLGKLIGMFAFAILDTQNRTLFLARDFFGIKPLYWYASDSFFAFASEVKGLIPLGVPMGLDPHGAFDYLQSGRILDNQRTVYSGVRSLPSAHCVLVPIDKPQTPHIRRYWEIDTTRVEDISFDEAAEEVRRLFMESLSLHMRSDVPLGGALSGGVDSSSIMCGMRELSTDADLKAVSFCPDGPISEEQWVDVVVAATGADVAKVRVTADDLARDIDALIDVQDEPFLNTSMYAQFLVMRAARENGLTVMLDGQGADEVLGGYTRYYGARVASLLRGFHPVRAYNVYISALKRPRVDARNIMASTLLKVLPVGLSRIARRVVGRRDVHPWLNAGWFRSKGIETQPRFRGAGGKYALKEELKCSVEEDLPQLLRYEDRNSMAFSIESRTPFLVPKLVQFLFSLPEEYLISDQSETKCVFKKSVRDFVPDEILDRKDKMGFPTPEHEWLTAMKPAMKGVFDGEMIESIPGIVSASVRGGWQADVDNCVYGSSAWRFFNYLRWAELRGISCD